MGNSRPGSRISKLPPAPDTRQLREQRLHWDRIALEMPDLYPVYSTGYYKRCEISLISRHFGPIAGKRVLKLDLWNETVNTRLLQWVSAQGAEAFGVDVSTVTIGRARDNNNRDGDRLHLYQSDVRYLPFADNSFDYVYTMGTIEHIPDYGRDTREVNRVLKPGGRALVGVPFKYDVFLRLIIVWLLERVGKYPYSPEKAFGSRELRDVLEESGLVPMRRTGILMLPSLIRIAKIFLYRRGIGMHRLLKPLVMPFDWLENKYHWPGHLEYLITYLARKPAESTPEPHQ